MAVLVPLQCILSFLWNYTWAALPAPLRVPLLQTLDASAAALKPLLRTEDQARRRKKRQGLDAREAMQQSAVQGCAAAVWALQGDMLFLRWRATPEGVAVPLPGFLTFAPSVDMADVEGIRRVARSLHSCRSRIGLQD